MHLRIAATAAGVVGGLCWVVRTFVASDVLFWGGALLLVIAVGWIGAGLADRGAVWLRVVVGIGVAALAWSMLEVGRKVTEDRLADGVAGGVALLVCAVVFMRPGHHSGNH